MTETLHRIFSLSEAKTAIDYFNGFHDGFIQQLVLDSRDKFEARGVHQLSGWLDLELTIAHYNYQQDKRPFDQLIQAKFFQLKDLVVNFSGQPHEWPIISFDIRAAERTNQINQQVKCFWAVFSFSHLQHDQTWDLEDDLVFTFAHAEIKEVPPGSPLG